MIKPISGNSLKALTNLSIMSVSGTQVVPKATKTTPYGNLFMNSSYSAGSALF